jgi:hypothetical protein
VTRLGEGLREILTEYGSRFSILLIPFLTVAVWPRVRRPIPAGHLVVWPVAAFHFLLLIFLFLMAGYVDARHVLPLLALSVPAAGAGTVYLSETLRRGLRFPGSERSTEAILVVGISLVMLPWCLQPIHPEYGPQLSAIKWLAREATPGDRIVTNSVHVPFLLDRQAEIIDAGQGGLSRRLQSGTTPGCTYVVLDTTYVGHFEQAWLGEIGSGFELASEFIQTVNGKDRRVLIFASREPRARVASAPP